MRDPEIAAELYQVELRFLELARRLDRVERLVLLLVRAVKMEQAEIEQLQPKRYPATQAISVFVLGG